MLEELAKYGTVNVRHAHGDWKNVHLSGWIEKLHPHAIRPVQQFAYLSKVGTYISNNSSFSPVNYGYRKLSELIKASELFEVEMRNDNKVIYIKDAR